ncbi:MAG: LuxR C-terminal-related transcriptional regulator, partial [Armatimonadetes bacterium]|nr:LuxR C-terminal-related transcriptional regulator [Armatimonadota bacterium]
MENEESLLSPRLLGVLHCAVEQKTTCTKKIAQFLGLKPQSVNTYWKHIKYRLSVEERHQAVDWFRSNETLHLNTDSLNKSGQVGGGG